MFLPVFGINKINSEEASIQTQEHLPHLLDGKIQAQGIIFARASGRINAIFKGSLFSDSTIGVGPQGHVTGDLSGAHISLAGFYEGEAIAQQHLSIEKTAQVNARCRSKSLTIQEGAAFDGLLVIGIEDKDLTSSWKHKVSL